MTAATIVGVTGTTLTGTNVPVLADASWFMTSSGEVVIDMVINTPLAKGDVFTLTFPSNVALADTSIFASISTQDTPRRINNQDEQSIELTCDSATLNPGKVRIVLDEVFVQVMPVETTYAIALTVNSAHGVSRLYGAALPAHGVQTRVGATVALAATIGVSTDTVHLGILSPHSVAEGRQTYYLHSNNASGVRVQIESDGPLRSVAGDVIDAVADGAVTAGVEEYGIAVENAQHVTIGNSFDTGDVALPQGQADISTNNAPVERGSFDLVYKASIDSNTPAGQYQQTVFFTILPNI